MASGILKVEFPPGSSIATKALKFELDAPASEAVNQILQTKKLPETPVDYVLLSVGGDGGMVLIDNNQPLSTYNLKQQDTVFVKTAQQVAKVYYYEPATETRKYPTETITTLIDLRKPFDENVLKNFGAKLRVDPAVLAKMAFYANGKRVALGSSVSHLRNFSFVCCSEGIQPPTPTDEDDDDDDDASGTADEGGAVDTAAPSTPGSVSHAIAYVRRASSSKKSGGVQIDKHGVLKKRLKSRKWEPRYCVLADRQLYYFKTENDVKPAGVLNLDEYSVGASKGEKVPFCFELTPNTGANAEKSYLFAAATETDMNEWITPLESGFLAILKARKVRKTSRADQRTLVFGAPIFRAVKPGETIPDIITQCVSCIDQKGLQLQGIFRLSGSAVVIQEYKAKFDKGEAVDLSREEDPHCVAGLLKLYLRELPEPLIPFAFYDSFIESQSIADEGGRLAYMKQLVSSLPSVNFEVLKYLLAFLERVSQHSDKNKMALHNLATVFGPNLLRSADDSLLAMVQDTAVINGIVNNFIKHHKFLFGDEELSEKEVIQATALYEYAAQSQEELSFSQGAVITVLEKHEDGWWKGSVNGKAGLFPGSYVEIRRKKFKEEMNHYQNKINVQAKKVTNLVLTVDKLQSEVQRLEQEEAALLQQFDELKNIITPACNLQEFIKDIEGYVKVLEDEEDLSRTVATTRTRFAQEFNSLKTAVHSDPKLSKTTKLKEPKVAKQFEAIAEKLELEKVARSNHAHQHQDLVSELAVLKSFLARVSS